MLIKQNNKILAEENLPEHGGERFVITDFTSTEDVTCKATACLIMQRNELRRNI